MWADSGGVTTEVAWFFGDLYSYSDASYRVVSVSFICASLVNWCWSRRRTWMDNNYLGSAPSGSARVWKAVCARTARRVADSSLTPLGTSLDSAIFTIVLLRAMRSALSQRGGVRCGSGCRFPLHIAPAEFARVLQHKLVESWEMHKCHTGPLWGPHADLLVVELPTRGSNTCRLDTLVTGVGVQVLWMRIPRTRTPPGLQCKIESLSLQFRSNAIQEVRSPVRTNVEQRANSGFRWHGYWRGNGARWADGFWCRRPTDVRLLYSCKEQTLLDINCIPFHFVIGNKNVVDFLNG